MFQIRIRIQPLPIYPDASSKRPDRMAMTSPLQKRKKFDKRMLRSNYRGKHKTQGNTRPDKTLKENRQTPTVQCTSMYDPTTGQSYKIKRPRGHGFGPDGHQYKYVEKNRINPAAAGQKEEKANVFFFCFFGFRFFLFVYCLQKSFGVWFVKVYCFDCDGSCCATN